MPLHFSPHAADCTFITLLVLPPSGTVSRQTYDTLPGDTIQTVVKSDTGLIDLLFEDGGHYTWWYFYYY